MADLRLERPVQGQNIDINADFNSRIVLDFPIDQVVMSRSDDNAGLIFTFDDGSSITIANFYENYSSDYMPDFIIDTQEVAGDQFFAAFDETLMPAAGPAETVTTVAANGTVIDFGADNLGSGIDSLGELSINALSTDASIALADVDNAGFLASAENTLGVTTPVTPPVNPPVRPDVNPPVNPPVRPDVSPPVNPPVNPDVTPPVNPPTPDVTPPPVVQDPMPTIDKVETDKNTAYVETESNDTLSTPIKTIQAGKDEFKPEVGSGGANVGYTELKPTIEMDGYNVSSVKVMFNTDGSVKSSEQYGTLGYNQAKEDDNGSHGKGLTVISNAGQDWQNEISAHRTEAQSEAVQIDLGDKMAYTLNLNLDAFFGETIFNDKPGEETSDGWTIPSDWKPETGTIYFYKTGEDGKDVLVHSMNIMGTANGKLSINEYVADGFDKVIIAPTHNDTTEGSSFLINGIGFVGLPEQYQGKVVFDMGSKADLDNSSIAFGINTNSNIESNIGNINVSIYTHASDSDQMIGTLDNGEMVFSAILSDDGSWVFKEYQDFRYHDGAPFELEFVIDNGNGETITVTTDMEKINLENQDNDVSTNTTGNDNLFGDEENDIIFGDSGDDYISGGDGADKLYGGDGNDIIRFDSSDLEVHGGKGFDIAIGGILGEEETMAGMLKGLDNIEMLITGSGASSLDSMTSLESIGITLNDDGNGVNFSENWTSGKTVEHNGENYTQVTHQTDHTGDDALTALVRTAMFDITSNS